MSSSFSRPSEGAQLLPFSTLLNHYYTLHPSSSWNHHNNRMMMMEHEIPSFIQYLWTSLVEISANSTTNNNNTAVVPVAQFVGEISITILQLLSFVVLLVFVLILLTCFTRESKTKTNNNTLNPSKSAKGQQQQQQPNSHRNDNDLLRRAHHQRLVAQQQHGSTQNCSDSNASVGDHESISPPNSPNLSTTTSSINSPFMVQNHASSSSSLNSQQQAKFVNESPNLTTNISQPMKRKVSKNKVILFSLMLPSVVILILLFGVRILTMGAFPVDTFLVEEKPLHVRVLNGLVYCGWALNDLMLVVQFLFISYIFLQTSRKLKYISQRVYKVLVISMIITPVILSCSVLGYVIAVMTDQITKPQQADGSAANVRPALIFFYSISTIIFIGSLFVALSYVIWTTVQLVRHLTAASIGAGMQLQQTTRTAVRKVVVIVTLVSVIAVFMCIMELIALIGELSNVSVYFAVISLIGKALATWIYIAGLCLLFGPLSSLKKYVKDIFNHANEKNSMESLMMHINNDSGAAASGISTDRTHDSEEDPQFKGSNMMDQSQLSDMESPSNNTQILDHTTLSAENTTMVHDENENAIGKPQQELIPTQQEPSSALMV